MEQIVEPCQDIYVSTQHCNVYEERDETRRDKTIRIYDLKKKEYTWNTTVVFVIYRTPYNRVWNVLYNDDFVRQIFKPR